MADRVTSNDLELLADLGVETEPSQTSGLSAREQRIIAGFEEIERFVEEHGRSPEHGETRDIFERLYAVRLDRTGKAMIDYEEKETWPDREATWVSTTKMPWRDTQGKCRLPRIGAESTYPHPSRSRSDDGRPRRNCTYASYR